MKILYIHQYFVTPYEPGATRSYWIARELVKRGHEVVMVTSTKPNGLHAPGREIIDGINVIYVNNPYSNHFSKIRKILAFIKFIVQSIAVSLKEHDIDIVFATSTPLTVGASALFLKRFKKTPFIFEVRDLWPEFPIEVGAIRNKLLIKWLRLFERRIYQQANHIIALSPGMKDGVVSAGIPCDKVTVIPNMAKPDAFYPREITAGALARFNLSPTKFYLIHFGAMGPINGLDYVVRAAKACKDRNLHDVEFLFVGSGACEASLKNMVKELDIDNVRFMGTFNMKELSELVNCCDVSIYTVAQLRVLTTSSPNKFFDTLSAGKPSAINMEGWIKDIVLDCDCGFWNDPNNPDEFAANIEKYKDDKDTLSRWGKNARLLALDKYDKAKLAAQACDVIENHCTK